MIKNFIEDENGQGMVEYGLIIALVAVVLIGALTLLSGNITGIFGAAGNALKSAAASTSGASSSST